MRRPINENSAFVHRVLLRRSAGANLRAVQAQGCLTGLQRRTAASCGDLVSREYGSTDLPRSERGTLHNGILPTPLGAALQPLAGTNRADNRPRGLSGPRKLLIPLNAGVAKLADAQDLKSWDSEESCGFDPRPRH